MVKLCVYQRIILIQISLIFEISQFLICKPVFYIWGSIEISWVKKDTSEKAFKALV